jgi:phage portal protein BeeE
MVAFHFETMKSCLRLIAHSITKLKVAQYQTSREIKEIKYNHRMLFIVNPRELQFRQVVIITNTSWNEIVRTSEI